jgi:hypothetical protein
MPDEWRPDKCGILLISRPDKWMQAWEMNKTKFVDSEIGKWIMKKVPKGWNIQIRYPVVRDNADPATSAASPRQ